MCELLPLFQDPIDFLCLSFESAPSLMISSISMSTSVSLHFAIAPKNPVAFPINSLLLCLHPGFSALISMPLPHYGSFQMVAGSTGKKVCQGKESMTAAWVATPALAYSPSSCFFVFIPLRKEGGWGKAMDFGNCRPIYTCQAVHTLSSIFIFANRILKNIYWSGVIFSHANIEGLSWNLKYSTWVLGNLANSQTGRC